jgi:hypothetical protein
MANKYQDELYEKLNSAFDKGTPKDNSRKEILKLVPMNTYVVRLIPNTEDPSKTFKRYFMHGWLSTADGGYISTGCPTTYDEECPICKEYFKLYNTKNEDSITLAKNLKRKSRLYANVFVVDDPTNPENNNTVKILSYGQQLEDIIENGWSGDDKEEVGARMFMFDENGCNLRIKVEKNAGGFPVYTSSKFLNPSKISVTLEDIKDQTHDLDALVKVKSKNELLVMIEEGLYGVTGTDTEDAEPKTEPKKQTAPAKVAKVAKDDEIPMEYKKPAVSTKAGDDEDVDDVLKGLDEFIKD